jgi:hypothetical protein
MIYVFDTSPISTLFKNYYRSIFKSLWLTFDEMVEDGRILSTREVMRELRDYPHDDLHPWLDANRALFPSPTPEEAAVVAEIFKERAFQQNIEQMKLLKGGKLADPFVVARAAVAGAEVVTVEKFKPNAAKIPNICNKFKIPCHSLEEFMQREKWTF